MNGVLAGRTAIVTGGSQGLGLAIAEAYIDAGAAVTIAARSRDRLAEAAEQLSRRAGDSARVLARVADVSKPEDTEDLAAAAIEHFGSVEILVNNAGVYGPMGRIEDVDWDEWTQALSVNLLGSVLMARALVPHFRARRYGKIVQLSGGGAHGSDASVSARTRPPRPRSCASPRRSGRSSARMASTSTRSRRGALNTRMLDEVLAAGPERVGQGFYDRALRQQEEGGAPLGRGAALAVFLASAQSDGLTGKLLSALWDPWRGAPGPSGGARRERRLHLAADHP